MQHSAYLVGLQIHAVSLALLAQLATEEKEEQKKLAARSLAQHRTARGSSGKGATHTSTCKGTPRFDVLRWVTKKTTTTIDEHGTTCRTIHRKFLSKFGWGRASGARCLFFLCARRCRGYPLAAAPAVRNLGLRACASKRPACWDRDEEGSRRGRRKGTRGREKKFRRRRRGFRELRKG